jgi:DNA-binding Lrp family transcriptional regulator
MDGIDRQIVAQMRAGARASFREIGEAVGLSAPAVKRRVDRLEADGVVLGYSAVVDAERMGWTAHALVSVFCEGRMTAGAVTEAVGRHPEVAAAYTVAGEASAVCMSSPPTAELSACSRIRESRILRRRRSSPLDAPRTSRVLAPGR